MRPVPSAPVAAATALALALTLAGPWYGYHRDELYFRMLPPAWGYVDQPPLTPWLARTLAGLVDEPWALRIPATLAAVVTVLLLAALCRELGGDRRAVALASWGAAFAALPLSLGHVLLTATLDLPLTIAVVLCAVRALRRDPRWWLALGAVAGLSALNRLLMPLVLLSLAASLLVLGPRRALANRWPWLGPFLALLLALPSILYQATYGWPQLAMGQALAAENAADTRASLPLILLVAIGPPLVPVLLAGAVHARRRPESRWVVPTTAVVIGFTWVAGAQPHYPVALLAVLWAAGCVPLSVWAGRAAWRRRTVVSLVALNAVVSTVIALPVVPLAVLGDTPLPGLTPLVADQVGWPTYTAQVASVWHGLDDPSVAVLTSNYGEAGAVDRYGRTAGLPRPVSGHNALWDLGPPAPSTRTVVVVGGQYESVRSLFETCTVALRLDNGLDVESEEQGEPVAVCTGPLRPWSQLWPTVRHLD